MVTHRTTCRSCGGKLDPILGLGDLKLSTFLSLEAPPPPAVPLTLCLCRHCDLAQLDRTVNPDLLFRQYWYQSSINETMQAELRDVVQQAIARVGPLQRSDVVLDIGANDGTLLQCYEGQPALRAAYEPARNLYDQLRPHCDLLVNGYFPEEKLGDTHPKIITSIACFYDTDEPLAYLQEIGRILHKRGVWVVQFQDLLSMIEATALDNLVHEHLLYLSLRDMEILCNQVGLQVSDAKLRPINGGSLRLYVQHAGMPQSPRVLTMEAREAALTYDALQQFAWRAGELKKQLHGLLEFLHDREQIVDVYGASTKFNTLSQYAGVKPPLVRWAVERDPRKVGLQTVTAIPIVSEETWRADQGGNLLAALWQFRDSIIERESRYLDSGGTWIFPCPQLEIVRWAPEVLSKHGSGGT